MKDLNELSYLIRRQYRTLSKEYHPDKVGGYGEKMKALNDAKEKLDDFMEDLKESQGVGYTLENSDSEQFSYTHSELNANCMNIIFTVITNISNCFWQRCQC